MKSAALVTLWANCVERLKDRVNNRSFWQAVENCQPIVIESDFLVLGMAPEHYHFATHMQQVSHAHVVQQTVREMFNQPLQVRVIEGTTPKDWEAVKERDARIAALRQAAATREIRRDVQSQGWDGVYESIARLYMQTPLRTLPQGKARYVNDALYTLAEAMDTLYPENPDEATERSVARILDRIANAADMPVTALAFELERLRAWRQAGVEQPETANENA